MKVKTAQRHIVQNKFRGVGDGLIISVLSSWVETVRASGWYPAIRQV